MASFAIWSLTLEARPEHSTSPPERKIVFSGDFIIWSCPNIGNPFKVQRYETEWAGALEQMAALHPDILVPGHGPVIWGEKIQKVCLNTARALRYLHEEVVKRLNQGAWIEQILDEVKLPEDLARKAYLAPIYGCPAFIIHGIHRRYAGWYDGNPSHLFPSKTSEIAREVVSLAGGPEALLSRAKALKEAGEIQLALHLVDFVLDNPETSDLSEAHSLKADLLEIRASVEPSFIARNIFTHAHVWSGKQLAKQVAPQAGLLVWVKHKGEKMAYTVSVYDSKRLIVHHRKSSYMIIKYK
ncbi:MAG: alkyl sulfatase dimerization domain-containing protein [Candidatus Freyrarchaeum guaymaensis]